MNSIVKKKKLAVITITYWFLLVYIIAALVWWFIALEQQNRQMFIYRTQQLQKDEPAYAQQYANVEKERKRKTAQYISEGITFLLLIIVGAIFVYRSTRRQIKFSQQQQNFVMAVTHELKTPVAVISLNNETLQKRKLNEEQREKITAHTLKETQRLDTLINNILAASQLETGKHAANKVEIDFSDMVTKSVENFINNFPARQIQTQIEKHLFVKGEPMLLQMLLHNLVDNAFKYSPANTTVYVVLKKIKDIAELKIIDEGEGIKNDEKKKVFEKFYRPGNEATRKTKGTGLGLYLCKKIVQQHKGQISIEDNLPQGTIINVRLRLLQA